MTEVVSFSCNLLVWNIAELGKLQCLKLGNRGKEGKGPGVHVWGFLPAFERLWGTLFLSEAVTMTTIHLYFKSQGYVGEHMLSSFFFFLMCVCKTFYKKNLGWNMENFRCPSHYCMVRAARSGNEAGLRRRGSFEANLIQRGGSPGQAHYWCGAVGGPDDGMTLEVSCHSHVGVRVRRTEMSEYAGGKGKRLCSNIAVKNHSWVFQSCANAAFAVSTGCKCSMERKYDCCNIWQPVNIKYC